MIPTAPEQSALPRASVWEHVSAFLSRRRVAISIIIFFSLIAEDLLSGVRPHDVLNVRDWHAVAGALLVLGGLALRSWAAGTLRKSQRLATTGVYSLMRHPLYVGSFLAMIGYCLIIGDPENFWIILGPVLALYLVHVHCEERRLKKRFGDAWDEYARRTWRFLPLRLSSYAPGEWRLSQWYLNREHVTAGAMLLAFVALFLWGHGYLHV